jgi:hypothetical protein
VHRVVQLALQTLRALVLLGHRAHVFLKDDLLRVIPQPLIRPSRILLQRLGRRPHPVDRLGVVEVGLALPLDALRVVGVIHRRAAEERVDFFLACRPGDGEESENLEPDRCSELAWVNLTSPPGDTIPYVRAGIEGFRRGVCFQEFAW